MGELAIEQTPDVADAAREAAGGQVVYITERGEPLAVIMPPDLAAALERLSADDLEVCLPRRHPQPGVRMWPSR